MANAVSHYLGKKKKKNGNKCNVILQFQSVTVPNIFIFNELLTLHQNMNAVVPRDGGDVSLQPAVLCRTFSVTCGCRVGASWACASGGISQ